MNEVTPWISDYFTNLATTYGSNYLSAPPVEKLRKCQVKKVYRVASVRSVRLHPLLDLGLDAGASRLLLGRSL